MRKNEQRLWDRMRQALVGKVRLERIENMVSVGRPDVDCLVDGHFTPVELKCISGFPARPTTRVLGDKGASLDQRNWHLDWQQHGGKSLFVVSVGSELFAVPGQYFDDLNSMTTAELRKFSRTWDGVLRLLRREELF
jgi:hypothetical protein